MDDRPAKHWPLIPAGGTVSANTPLIPQLAQREVLVRFPGSMSYLDRDRRQRQVEWIAMDLDWMSRYAAAFRKERVELEASLLRLDDLLGDYGVRRVADGVVILQKGARMIPRPADPVRIGCGPGSLVSGSGRPPPLLRRCPHRPSLRGASSDQIPPG